MNESKHYLQVEIPKFPRWLADILAQCQTDDYSNFKTIFAFRCCDMSIHKDLSKYLETHNKKDIDLAILLGAWEVE